MKIAKFFGLTCLVMLSSVTASQAGPDQMRQVEDLIARGDIKGVAKSVGALPAAQRDVFVKALGVKPRIVGGTPAAFANYPWQVALVRASDAEPSRSQFCGGSLIAPDVVLTAAHCVDNPVVRKLPGRLDVVAGTASYAAGGERLSVKAIFIHPQWNATTYDYDFALLKLRSPARIGRPIALQAAPVAVGERVVVSGWGATSEGGDGSPDLLKVEVPVVDSSICNEAESYGGSVTDQMLCAGQREGGLDACQGDSGGPLAVGLPAAPRLAGVVSWGEGCARRYKYGVYARVSAVAPWIQSLAAGATVQAANAPAPAGGISSGGR